MHKMEEKSIIIFFSPHSFTTYLRQCKFKMIDKVMIYVIKKQSM